MKKEQESKKSQETEENKISPLEELQNQLNEEKNSYLRLQAEFANYKKRTEENNARTYEIATVDVFKKIINVFDDFDLALNNISDVESFKKGIEMVYAKLVSTSEDAGIEKIKTTNEKFNPHEHEALLVEESKEPQGTILEELQSGYKFKNTVLRTAKVKVSK